MLTPKLQEIKNKIVAKQISSRTDKEAALLSELEVVDKLLGVSLIQESLSSELRKTASASTRITSGPNSCPCCGRS